MPRERRPVERYRPSNEPVQPQRNRRKNDTQAPAQAPVPAPAPDPAPVQRMQQPRRTLDLTLKKVDAVSYDISDPESEFYEKYFDKPDDDITRRLDNLDYSKHKKAVYCRLLAYFSRLLPSPSLFQPSPAVYQFFSVLRKQIYMVKKDHRVVVGGVGSKQPPVL